MNEEKLKRFKTDNHANFDKPDLEESNCFI